MKAIFELDGHEFRKAIADGVMLPFAESILSVEESVISKPAEKKSRTKKEQAAKPEQEDAPVTAEEQQEEEETEVGTTYTLEAVRAKASEIAKAGKREEVKALLSKMGYSRVTDLPEEKYDEFMGKVAGL